VLEKQPEADHSPLISVVIPTVGRESLGRAIKSALEQDVPDGGVEVVVANDSGRTLTTAASVLADPRVRIIATNRRRQSVARNTGAAVAAGRYLLFLDDDDWLATGALASLLKPMRSVSSFVVSYGRALLRDATGQAIGRIDLGRSGNCASQTLAGAVISIGSGLIDGQVFFVAGGFDATLPNGDEVSLFRRLAMLGDFSYVDRVVVNILRGEGWKTSVDHARSSVESLRASREHLLDQKGAYHRLIHSADGAYWRARLVKAYAASGFWNLKNRRPLKMLSRTGYLLVSVAATLGSFATRDYWRALADSQVPATFQRALEDYRKERLA
jgi:glycosyltransferase involved in cell wall biosynthesis